jgi:protein SCO1/2
MRPAADGLRRREALCALAGAGLALPAAASVSRGLVLPRAPAPEMDVVCAAGREQPLAAMLRGRVSCVQLMFTGCATTCPPQGAMFAALSQRPLPPDVLLLSLTIDPLGDGPQQLDRWLGRFPRAPFWTAAAPRPADVGRLQAFLRGAPAKAGTHGTQAFLVDRDARLAFRSVEHPTPEHLADLLGQLARA